MNEEELYRKYLELKERGSEGRLLSRLPAPFGGGETPVDGEALEPGDGVRQCL